MKYYCNNKRLETLALVVEKFLLRGLPGEIIYILDPKEEPLTILISEGGIDFSWLVTRIGVKFDLGFYTEAIVETMRNVNACNLNRCFFYNRGDEFLL